MTSKKYDVWDRDCWVRQGGKRGLLGQLNPNANDFFPCSLIPYASRLQAAYGRRSLQEVQIQTLHSYLWFTELVELKSINQVGHQIALGELPVSVSADLRSRAYLLVRDEAHHAAVSDDLADQIEQATGVSRLAEVTPQYLITLGRLKESVGRENSPLLDIGFATISETLISGSLAQIPADPAVIPLIRDYAQAHAVDEGRHASYFSDFFRQWWPQLPLAARQQVGPYLPDLCLAFLAPDLPAHQRALESVGVPTVQAEAWLREAFPQDQLATSARRSVQATLSLFRRTGVFDDPRTHDAFAASQLL